MKYRYRLHAETAKKDLNDRPAFGGLCSSLHIGEHRRTSLYSAGCPRYSAYEIGCYRWEQPVAFAPCPINVFSTSLPIYTATRHLKLDCSRIDSFRSCKRVSWPFLSSFVRRYARGYDMQARTERPTDRPTDPRCPVRLVEICTASFCAWRGFNEGLPFFFLRFAPYAYIDSFWNKRAFAV